MAIVLKNSSNVVQYEFPSSCNFEAEDWSKRLGYASRAYQHGATLTGDEKVATRIVSVRGIFGLSHINATYGVTVSANLKEMKQQCHIQDLRLYPGAQYANEYYNVECQNFEGYWRRATPIIEVDIDFLVADPFRYYKDATTDTEAGITASPHAYTITTNDGDEAVYPVITFTGGASTNLTKIKIANAEDGAKYFEVTVAIGNADAIEIDCQEGTCEKNGSDIIDNFTGAFIKIASGTNNIVITSTGTVGTCSCVAVFRKRYL